MPQRGIRFGPSRGLSAGLTKKGHAALYSFLLCLFFFVRTIVGARYYLPDRLGEI